MGLRVHLLGHHQEFTNGLVVLEVEGKTVGECLEDLVRQYPRIQRELFPERGKLSNLLEIFVNGQSAYPNELFKPVHDGDEIFIVHILGGG